MCGRARCTLNPAQVVRAFGFTTAGGNGGCGDGSAVPMHQLDRYRPSYNVSPGAYLPVGTVRKQPAGGAEGEEATAEARPVIQCMKWGLVPSFTKKTEKPDHFRMFNARSESIKEKASFCRLIPKNRCLVAVEGFYEWKKDGSKKQPYYIHFQDQRPLVFAALYDMWTNSEGEILHTFTILTTRASPALEWLHDRMPVILGNKGSIDTWLNHASVKLETITVPYEGPNLVWYPVTTAIGKTSFDGPECIKEVQLKPTCDKPISKFFMKKSDGNDQSEKLRKTSKEETHAFDTSKEEPNGTEYDQLERVIQQQPENAFSRVKVEPLTNESEELQKALMIGKYEDIPLPDTESGKQDTCGIKREFEDVKTDSDLNIENIDSLAFGPLKKKEKGPKNARDGQASLLSYFARK